MLGSACPLIPKTENDQDSSRLLNKSQSASTFIKIRPVSHYLARAPESKIVMRFIKPRSGRPKSAVTAINYNKLKTPLKNESVTNLSQSKNNMYRNDTTD